MKIRMMAKLGMFAFGAALLPMLTAGCNNKPKETAKHDAPKEAPEPPKSIDSINELQAINGAKNDPSLSSSHFDGADLNALGKSKMQLIIRGTQPGKPVIVYLNAGKSELTQSRRTAVEQYWKSSMMTQAHLEIRDGGADAGGSASEALRRLPLANSNPEGSNVTNGPTSPSGNNNSDNNSGGTGPQETLFK